MSSKESEKILKDISGLRSAIEEEDYPRIYKELGRFTAPFSHADACRLLKDALRAGLKIGVFEAVVSKSPPVPELISTYYQEIKEITSHDYEPDMMDESPLEAAAYLDRADVLSLFLERGAGPNRNHCAWYSPLEAAVRGDAINSVEMLMQQPELDTTWTHTLMLEWTRPRDSFDRLESCRRAMAARFTGWVQLSGWPLPIPGPATPRIIAEALNWPLLELFCRERGPFSPEDGRDAMKIADINVIYRAGGRPRLDEEGETACARALAALLNSCPDLPQVEYDRRKILHFFLKLGADAREHLRPWVDKMRPLRLSMPWADWADWEIDRFPDHWRSLLPDGPTLLIDRWSWMWGNLLSIWYTQSGQHSGQHSAELLSHVLDLCPVIAEPRKGRVSHLAAAVLHYGGFPLVLSQLERSGGVLATEDPGALIDYVQCHGLPRDVCMAVLAHVRRDVDYEL